MSNIPSITATVQISSRAAQQLKGGLLWIYSNEIRDRSQIKEPGEACWFSCNGQIVATGYFNVHSLITGRALSFAKEDNLESLLIHRLKAALKRRPAPEKNNSMRLVFSEADFIPGLIVDWFSGALVFQSNTAGMDRLLPMISESLVRLLEESHVEVRAVVHRCDSGIRTLEGLTSFSTAIRGSEETLRNWSFQESGLTFSADLLDGQKTGFFLDQKENRDFLGDWIKAHHPKKVLDLFCYSGGWGMRGLQQDAEKVVFVDQSGDALGLVKTAAVKNGFASDRLHCVQDDVFDYLTKTSEMFDAVIADPPAFVKSKKNLPQAMKAYEKLVRLSWQKVNKNGLLVISSCSYHVPDADFLLMVREAVSKESGMAHVIYRGRQGLDHPFLLSMPETNYLKCIGLQKL